MLKVSVYTRILINIGLEEINEKIDNAQWVRLRKHYIFSQSVRSEPITSNHQPNPANLASICGHVRSGWGGDWFGSDSLSKRVVYYDPSKSIFVSRTPCQTQNKLSFSEEKQ